MSIIFVYSGGATNVDAFKSIGGIASAYKIPNDAVNNLFPNMPGWDDLAVIDYRCIYAINNSQSIHYSCEAYLTNTSGGADVYLGISKLNSVQKMTINGNVTGGSISLNYKDRLDEDNAINVNHDSNLETWGNNLQTALNGIESLSGVIVNTRSALSDNIFDITFADSGGEPSVQNGGFRGQNLITVSNNNLTGSNSITINHAQVGHPIDSLAAEPGVPTNAPAGVDFKEVSSPGSTIYIGNLYPEDVFAIWFKRVTPTISDRYAEAVEDVAKIVIVDSPEDEPEGGE
jgi:hypothetical protein